MNTYANPLIQMKPVAPVPDTSQVFQRLRSEAHKEIQRRLSPDEQLGVRQGGSASQKARQVIREYIDRQNLQFLSNPALGIWPDGTEEELTTRIYRLLYGLGPIEVLLEQPDIEDIAINGPGEIYVRTSLGWSEIPTETVSDLAGNPDSLLFMFNQAISASGQQAGPMKPIIDDRLPSGHRISIVTDPVAADGVLAHRSHPPPPGSSLSAYGLYQETRHHLSTQAA